MKPLVVIFLVNLLTSIDNAIVVGGIAKRYQNLLLIGSVSALVITVLRTTIIMGVVSASKVPGLRMGLGFVAIWVAFHLVNVREPTERAKGPSLLRLLFIIVAMDTALSLDNILTIAVVSHNVIAIAVGVFLSLLPLLLLLPL